MISLFLGLNWISFFFWRLFLLGLQQVAMSLGGAMRSFLCATVFAGVVQWWLSYGCRRVVSFSVVGKWSFRPSQTVTLLISSDSDHLKMGTGFLGWLKLTRVKSCCCLSEFDSVFVVNGGVPCFDFWFVSDLLRYAVINAFGLTLPQQRFCFVSQLCRRRSLLWFEVILVCLAWKCYYACYDFHSELLVRELIRVDNGFIHH